MYTASSAKVLHLALPDTSTTVYVSLCGRVAWTVLRCVEGREPSTAEFLWLFNPARADRLPPCRGCHERARRLS